MFQVKLNEIPENISFYIVQNSTVHHILPHDKENTAIQTMHTAKQIVYSKRTDGKLLLLKICKSRKWLITYQYLPLFKDGILRRVTVLLYLSKPSTEEKRKLWKSITSLKETVFYHTSPTVERKISTEIFSTNFKVFDIVMGQQDSLRRRDSPRGVSWEFLVGMCRPVLRILALF